MLYGFKAVGNEWGPQIQFSPLKNLPHWLRRAGCHEESFQLRGTLHSKGLPLEELSLRCAVAAAMVNQSEFRALDVEHLWNSGAFDGVMKEVVPSSVFHAMSEACKHSAQQWVGPEAIEAITSASQHPEAPATDVVSALAHELDLLQRCELGLNELAKGANVPPRAAKS